MTALTEKELFGIPGDEYADDDGFDLTRIHDAAKHGLKGDALKAYIETEIKRQCGRAA